MIPFPGTELMIHPSWGRRPAERGGITIVELMVTCAIVAMVFFVVWQLFSSGIRGSQVTQETIDHIRDSAILFRAIDRDIQQMVPWPVRDSSGNDRGGEVVYAPSGQNAHEMRFWARNGSGFHQVRYRFAAEAKEKKLFREELNGVGSVVRSENFGGAVIENFLVRSTGERGDCVKVTVVFCGKLKKNTVFERVFAIGALSPEGARHWVYD